MFDAIRKLINDRMAEVNVAWPGIIRAFDAATQTVRVDVAIKKVDGTAFTQLVDVPVVFQTAGGYSLTLPIAAGDECLVVIADRCIDYWFTRGGVQPQAELRIHDIADGFAILGVRSKPKALTGYSSANAELRNDDNDQVIRLKPNGDIEVESTTKIKMTAPDVEIVGNVAVTGTIDATGIITSTVDVVGATASLESHTHTYNPGAGAPTETSVSN